MSRSIDRAAAALRVLELESVDSFTREVCRAAADKLLARARKKRRKSLERIMGGDIPKSFVLFGAVVNGEEAELVERDGNLVYELVPLELEKGNKCRLAWDFNDVKGAAV